MNTLLTHLKISDTIDFSPGHIVYEELAVDNWQEWIAQEDNLNEDLLQVAFPGEVVLDVGWYPAFSRHGKFQVRVIRDAQWDTPIFYAEVAGPDVLRSVVDAARQTATEAALAIV